MFMSPYRCSIGPPRCVYTILIVTERRQGWLWSPMVKVIARYGGGKKVLCDRSYIRTLTLVHFDVEYQRAGVFVDVVIWETPKGLSPPISSYLP